MNLGLSTLALGPRTVIDDRYELVRPLGSGAMGTVYLAVDRKLDGGFVALKFLYPHLVSNDVSFQRFRNEVLVARKLAHPNIVRTYNIGMGGDFPYISMEYIEGETLKAILQNRHPSGMPESLALKAFAEICCAVRYSHVRGVIHRDIKPENVLVGETSVKVNDFGLAATIRRETQLTRTGQVLGTPSYMAPEQFRGMMPGVQSDIYSLGILLYEILFGTVPFTDRSLYGLSNKHATEPLPRPKRFRTPLQEVLWNVAERCSRKRPDERYADIGTLLRDLEAQSGTSNELGSLLVSELPAPAAPSSEEIPAKPSFRLSRFSIFALSMLFVVASVGWIRSNSSLQAMLTLPVLLGERHLGTRFSRIREIFNLRIQGPPRPLIDEMFLQSTALHIRLLAGDDPNAPENRNSAGLAPIHQAAANGSLEDVELLLSYGADVNISDNSENTPLQYAVANGHAMMVRKLLTVGARPNVRNVIGEIPLIIAVRRLARTENRWVVDDLLKHGADPALQDATGRDALGASLEFARSLDLFRTLLPFNKNFSDEHLTATLLYTPDPLKPAVRQLWLEAGTTPPR